VLKWNFLTEDLPGDAIYLDCRSEEQYAASTIRSAHGASFIKKPYGSGPRSLAKLSSYLKPILELARDGKEIIVFDEGEGMYASRLLWVLNGVGLTRARMLSKRFVDLPIDLLEPGKTPLVPASEEEAPLKIKGIVPINFVQQNLIRMQILDVRIPDEYDGNVPRMVNPEIGSVCGRIPGSLNWDWRLLYGPDGHLKSKAEMISYIRKIGLIQERPTMIYDYNGARSCTTALVLTRCGYKQIDVYLGSWMEWRKTSLPKQNVRTWAGD